MGGGQLSAREQRKEKRAGCVLCAQGGDEESAPPRTLGAIERYLQKRNSP